MYTVFLAGNSPYIRSYTVYICGSGQPYTYAFVAPWCFTVPTILLVHGVQTHTHTLIHTYPTHVYVFTYTHTHTSTHTHKWHTHIHIHIHKTHDTLSHTHTHTHTNTHPLCIGYVSGTYFKMMGGHNWVANVMLTAVLWFGPVTAVFSYLNTVAIFYRVSSARVLRHLFPVELWFRGPVIAVSSP